MSAQATTPTTNVLNAEPPRRWSADLVPAIGGGIVLAAGATPWMSRPVEIDDGTSLVDTATLWGLLATVNSTWLIHLVMAIVFIVGPAVLLIVHTRPGLRCCAGWLGAVATAGIWLNIDSGYTAGAGLLIALVTFVVVATVTSIQLAVGRTRST